MPITTNNALSAPSLDGAARDLAAATASPPFLYALPVQDGRDLFESLVTAPIPTDATTVETVTLTTPLAGDFPVHVVRPREAGGPLPVVLFVHGLGWTYGSFATHERVVRELAAASGAAVVFPEYHLAPEHRYPTQLEEALAALAWARDQAGELGLDGGRVAVFGDSVGGGMATVVARLQAQRGGGALAAQVLVYPVLDATRADTASYEQFADGPFLTRELQRWFWDNYLPDGQDRADPAVSPLLAADADVAALPPSLIITAESDPVRDEGEAYAARLRDSSVEVLSVRYGGTIHDFARIDALAGTPAARAANAQDARFLREHLHSTGR
jgi:acetyl esterase